MYWSINPKKIASGGVFNFKPLVLFRVTVHNMKIVHLTLVWTSQKTCVEPEKVDWWWSKCIDNCSQNGVSLEYLWQVSLSWHLEHHSESRQETTQPISEGNMMLHCVDSTSANRPTNRSALNSKGAEAKVRVVAHSQSKTQPDDERETAAAPR